MSDKPFLDSNILIYAFASGDARKEKAEALVAAGGIVSVQVLNEFVNVWRRKQGRDWNELLEALAVLKTLLDPPLPLTMETHELALNVARAHGFRFYDSLIIAAALRASCPVLYTEDLQHGQTIKHLSIRNPFAA